MSSPCLHEQDWGRVIEMVERQHKDIYGNGKPGLNQAVTELSVKIDTMTETINDLSRSVSALVKFENEISGVEKYKEAEKKNTLSRWQIMGIVFAIIVGFATVYNIIDNKKTKQENELVLNWMKLWDFSPVTRGGQPILDTTKFNM